MERKHPDALEADLDEALAHDRYDAAATLAIEGYGGEIYGFLVSRLGSDQQANEVFSVFLEDLWRGLPSYARRASFRAWAYALARNACHRYLDRDVKPRRQESPLSEAPELGQLAERVRTQTAQHLRTTGQQRGAALRSRLREDEQVLLTLRLDRGLGWREVAEALGANSEELDAEAARL